VPILEDGFEEEMKYFGQEVYVAAQAASGNLNDLTYTGARARSIQNARVKAIDGTLNSKSPPLDVLVAPTWSALLSIAAVAGYPSASLPVGFVGGGSPVGFCIVGSAWQEAKMLGFAYDLEQELNAQVPPQYLGSVPHEPPNAGICTTPQPRVQGETGNIDWRSLHLL